MSASQRQNPASGPKRPPSSGPRRASPGRKPAAARAGAAKARKPWSPLAALAIGVAVMLGGGFGLRAALAAPIHVNLFHRLMTHLEDRHPGALWHVVHGLCVRDMQLSGQPAPCAKVDLAAGYAVIKDVQRRTQFLLVPTRRIVGIESPQLLAADAPNFWADAWSARDLVSRQVGHDLPREDIGLAVNSVPGRTQNQLHIHIDCVRPDVVDKLRKRVDQVGPGWARLRGGLDGHPYRARWIDDAALADQDPFKLLAQDNPDARADMGDQTLVLIGARRADGAAGFVLLNAQADPAHYDIAAGEWLLDHSCRVADQQT